MGCRDSVRSPDEFFPADGVLDFELARDGPLRRSAFCFFTRDDARRGPSRGLRRAGTSGDEAGASSWLGWRERAGRLVGGPGRPAGGGPTLAFRAARVFIGRRCPTTADRVAFRAQALSDPPGHRVRAGAEADLPELSARARSVYKGIAQTRPARWQGFYPDLEDEPSKSSVALGPHKPLLGEQFPELGASAHPVNRLILPKRRDNTVKGKRPLALGVRESPRGSTSGDLQAARNMKEQIVRFVSPGAPTPELRNKRGSRLLHDHAAAGLGGPHALG